MALNPMQRKVRIAGVLGFLIGIIIAIAVGALMFLKILDLEKEKQNTQSLSKSVYVLNRDIKSGEKIESSDIENVKIITKMTTDNSATPGDFSEEDKMSKIDLPVGTILTKSMITTADEKVTDDLREQEYNMIALPSNLTENDYIDIRIQYPNGQNYIVIARKRVVSATKDTIFLKMSEMDIQTMTSAIVESYMIDGSLLYATKLEDAGIQKALTPTYNVSMDVYNLMVENPNIVFTARQELSQRLNANRRNEINTILNESSQGVTGVKSGLETQVQKQNTERTRYLEKIGLAE